MLINSIRFLLITTSFSLSILLATSPTCSAAATKKNSKNSSSAKGTYTKLSSSKSSATAGKQVKKTSGYRLITAKPQSSSAKNNSKSSKSSKGTYSKSAKKSSSSYKAVNRSLTYYQIKGKEEKVLPKGLNSETNPASRVTINDERGKFGLDRVNVNYDRSSATLQSIPTFETEFAGRIAALNQKNDFIFFPTKTDLQKLASEIARKASADHVGIVVMSPKTGEILAMAGKSKSISNPVFHSQYPAASLFKVITTTAGLELGKIRSNSFINFRGSDYTLERWNYFPDNHRDNRSMSVEDALGKSCNPVFGRIALNYLNAKSLQDYAERYGFNDDIFSDYNLSKSYAYIPSDDYSLSRAAAGFGQVTISPIHAAALMSTIANGGVLMKPRLIDRIVDSAGIIQYKSQPTSIRRVMTPKTASQLLDMMEATTLSGTTRREFAKGGAKILPWRVAGKTGTLNGSNPKGLNQWFIATAPIENPQVALAVVTVNKRNSLSSPAHIGKQLIQAALQ